MSFDLRVEFTGLCMYLVHADPPDTRSAGDEMEAHKVTVVIPECRKDVAERRHADNDQGKHHVGYMRLDLASIAGISARIPSAPGKEIPAYEVVHRFTNQTLDFGLSAAPSMVVHTRLPEFDAFAPALVPRPELLDDAKAGAFAVMRTTLTGGTLKGEEARQEWKFSDTFSEGREEYSGTFAETLVWSREVADADSLTLTLTPFKGGDPQHITLTPVEGPNGKRTLALKIANLCCENPLEWKELESGGAIERDDDFKWLYRLMLPAPGETFRSMLATRGAGSKLPVPELIGPDRGGQGCVGGSVIVRSS